MPLRRYSCYSVVCWYLIGCSGAPVKAPCDATTLATITAECSAVAFQCGHDGVPEDQCADEVACEKKLDERQEACK